MSQGNGPVSDSQDSSVREFQVDWQSLLGFGGALVGLFFVLLNSGYVRFYEELSVRPEEVGLDRVGVLARTAGIAFAVSVVVSAVIGIAYSIPFFREHRRLALCVFYIAILALCAYSLIARNYWVQGIAIPFLLLIFSFVFFTAHKRINRLVVVSGIFVGLAALCLVMRAELHAVNYRLERVANGRPVAPIKLLNFPILDISAEPAQITLLDKIEKFPVELSDPYLLFLGKGPSGVALVGCGNTVIMPTDKVSVRTGSGVDFRNYTQWRDRNKAQLRWSFCQCVHANEDGCESLTKGESSRSGSDGG